jgi:hypothetical protein
MTFLSEESVASGCEKFGIEATGTDGEKSLADQQNDDDATRATAHLPGLEIEMVHRRPADNVEQISINLQAAPSFEEFGRFLEVANPFTFWFRAAEMMWLSRSGVAQMMLLPFTVASPLLRLGSSGSHDTSGQHNA